MKMAKWDKKNLNLALNFLCPSSSELIFIVAKEKESGMKEMLSIMGVSLRMQWFAWWARALAGAVFASVIVAIGIVIIYPNINLGVILILLLSYCLAFISFAFFITTW